MKRKYNTLNEEMNRMKSLFGESRLYGNLVDAEKEIISEQWRFFNNIKKGFRLGGKGIGSIGNDFAKLGRYSDFLGREVKNTDDIIKHLTEFSDIWSDLLPKWDFVKLQRQLKEVGENLDRLEGFPREAFKKNVLQFFPEIGGMQNMVDDMWKRANGQKMKHVYVNPMTPAVKGDTRVSVAIDPKTKEIILSPTAKEAEGAISTKAEFDTWRKDIDAEMDVEMVMTLMDQDGRLHGRDADGKWYSKGEDGKWVEIKRDWDEGMTVYNEAGEEVGTYNKYGELIDSKGNIVDKKGNIMKKVDVDDVGFEVVPEGSTPDEMDGKTYSDNGDNLKNVDESFDDAQREGGGYVGKDTNINEQAFKDRQMAHDERMANLELSAEAKKLERERFEFEKQKYEDAKKKGNESSVDVTGENIAEVKKTFREKMGLTGKFFDFIFWPLSIKDGDIGITRIAKQTGSAVVDPLGVLGWFQKFKPPNAKLVYSSKSATWNRTFRAVLGTGFNLMLWNAIMWKKYKNEDYLFYNIVPTYWKNIKNNIATRAVSRYLNWQFSDQFTEMCKELEDSSGKDCNGWLTGYGDDIEKHLKKYVDGKDCEALKAMRDSNGNLNREEYGKAAKYMTEEYNKEMRSHISVTWLEDFMEWAMGWKTDITNLTTDVFEEYEIDITNGGGKTEKFNAIEHYFDVALIHECGKENQQNQENQQIQEDQIKKVVVEGGVVWG